MIKEKRDKISPLEPVSIIRIRVQTRAGKNEVSEMMPDGRIKMRLTAPPVDGLANDELVRFLGKLLRTAPSNISIINGLKSREKVVAVRGVDPQRITNILGENAGKKG